jgi:FAD:protein FMN transferase
MQKMSTNLSRQRLQGPTMGTQWSAVIDGLGARKAHLLQAALQQAVQDVDDQMTTWRKTSDLMRLNAAAVDRWIDVPSQLMRVLAAGLAISRATDGAFELNLGDAVQAWGFGVAPIDLGNIRAASQSPRVRAVDALELDESAQRVRKTAPLALDLSGIAKGYGVDRMAQVLAGFGITSALCAIDGELRALGTQADGSAWAVAIETPDSDSDTRLAHAHLALGTGAVATSGDYRHFVTVKGHRLSHTIDPSRRAPRVSAPASVSVLAQNCMQADAMATALMVMGHETGYAYAKKHNISALFLVRRARGLTAYGVGVFAGQIDDADF